MYTIVEIMPRPMQASVRIWNYDFIEGTVAKM